MVEEEDEEESEEEEEDAGLAAGWADIGGCSSDDDVLDDALDAMLEAEATGVKPFHDDFDSMQAREDEAAAAAEVDDDDDDEDSGGPFG